MPEDPEAGARSVAQWREHLKEEERERKMRHDRRKLAEHRRVLQQLRATQKQYDTASTAQAVATAERSFRVSVPELEKSFDTIDHYGGSSGLVPEYRRLVEMLTSAYPKARVAALAGSKAELGAIEADAKARFETIDEWLKEAAGDDD